jgi:hypothetical protein
MVGYERWFNETLFRIRVLIDRTGLDSTLATPLLRRLAERDSVWHERKPSPQQADTAFPTDLQRWFAAAATLSPERHAAAYFAADQLAGIGAGMNAMYDRDNDEWRARMEDLGATILYIEADAQYMYAHSWLQRAIKLDPGGRTGIEARVWKLDHWCEIHPGGGDHSEEALAEATAMLKLDFDPATNARAHFFSGDAYRDRVALAHGYSVISDSGPYVAGESDARRAAIVHYRAGLALDSTSREAVWVKEALEVLSSGGRPNSTAFLCWQSE